MKLFSPRSKVFLVIIALVFVLSLNLVSNQVRGFFTGVLSPVQGFFWDLGQTSSQFFSGIFRGALLEKENSKLEERMLALSQELLSLQSVEKENEQLREALSLGIEKEFHVLSSRILGKDPSQDILILDKGSRDGIVIGMAVITPAKAVVGRIGEVFEGSSTVILLSHPESSFEAKILREGIVGAVQGKGGYQAFLDLIPQDSTVVLGDIVVSASLGGVFPENLLIGEVTDIKVSNEKSFQQAELSLFFDVRKAGLLFIIQSE